MARIHGRNGRLYVSITSTSTNAEAIAFLTKWSLDSSTDRTDVTAFGDTNKTFLAGLPAQTGAYEGWYDNATAQLYTAAIDGVARRFYLYPDNTLTTQYWFGTGFFDFSIETPVDGGVSIKGSFDAASAVSKVG